jgi:outer membrane protein OmpA-like peptidoglycan-associated protein
VQGPTGPTGATGVVGVVECWVTYRAFWFDDGKSDVRASDASVVAEIAAYHKENPSLQLGIDGVYDSTAPGLRTRRANAVRDALTQAGVPADKITIGDLGNPKDRQLGRVEVLLRTAN